ncbi:60S ribosomal protein L10A [Binucleata daphniae]
MSTYFTKDKLLPLIAQTMDKKSKTIDCQITIKNYDFKKDVRFDSNIALPHQNKKNPKVLVLATKEMEEVCKDLKYEYVLLESIGGKEKTKMKKKLAKKYSAFISVPTFNKWFEMRILACKNKPVYTIKNITELQPQYENVIKTIKFKLRKSVNFGFAIGNSEQSVEELGENMSVAMNHFVSLLKKGMQNIQSVYVKNNQGKSVKVI